MRMTAVLSFAAIFMIAAAEEAKVDQLSPTMIQGARQITHAHQQRAMSPAPQIAQADQCPDGANYCGYGICCAADSPNLCPQSRRCYPNTKDARNDCGNGYVICGRPVR